MATIAVALKVKTLEALRQNADALQALQNAIAQIVGQPIKVQNYGQDWYFMVEGRTYRYVVLGTSGLSFVGDFTAQERQQIQAFAEALPLAMAEQAMVNALATQLQLLDDQPVWNETGQQIGRTLVVRV